MAWSKAKTAIVAGAIVLAAAGTSTNVVHRLVKTHTGTSGGAIKQFEQTTNGRLSMEAVYFLQSLKQKGRLPGIASNTPAGIEIPWVTFDHPGGTAHVINTNLTFPLSLTLIVHANDINERYHYTVTKATQTNEWHLQKAWCSDTNEIVLQEFSIW